ncbi:hypothetical protein FACS18949_03050 [Clostridia bacterium]|nr:hypothetical protein FACS18949_03050 [Clostridia bacterium]
MNRYPVDKKGFISLCTTDPGKQGFVKVSAKALVEVLENVNPDAWWNLPGFRSAENCAKCAYAHNTATGEIEGECSMCYAAKYPTFEEAQKHACDNFDDFKDFE